jgi:SAM-dependent methyltransferase
MTVHDIDEWVYSHQTSGYSQSRGEIESAFKDFVPYYMYRLKRYLPLNSNALILDLPCGDGTFLYFLNQCGYINTKGFDIDRRRIAIGQLLGLPMVHGDVFKQLGEEPNSSVDCIISMDFLEHLEKTSAIEWLGLCFQKLAVNGTVLIRMPCSDGLFGSRDMCNDFSHKWGATSGLIQRLLTATGFDEVTVFGEDPIVARWWDVFRVSLCSVFRSIATIVFVIMGMPRPVIWSSSMWAIAKKKELCETK